MAFGAARAEKIVCQTALVHSSGKVVEHNPAEVGHVQEEVAGHIGVGDLDCSPEEGAGHNGVHVGSLVALVARNNRSKQQFEPIHLVPVGRSEAPHALEFVALVARSNSAKLIVALFLGSHAEPTSLE